MKRDRSDKFCRLNNNLSVPFLSDPFPKRYATVCVYPFGNRSDEMRYRTHFFIHFLSCKRTAPFRLPGPCKALYEPAMVLVQRPQLLNACSKKQLSVPQRKKRVNRSIPVPMMDRGGGGYFGVKRIGLTFGNPRKLP